MMISTGAPGTDTLAVENKSHAGVPAKERPNAAGSNDSQRVAPRVPNQMGKDNFFPATAMPDRHWWAKLWPDPDAVLRSLGVKPGMVVVDLCCGDGYFTVPLSRIVEGKVYGLDIDFELLKVTLAALKRKGLTVRNLICADAFDLSKLLPSKVDYILLANTFHGVPDKTKLAIAVAAALERGGKFVIVNWHRLPRGNTKVLGKPRGPKTEMRMTPEDVLSAVEPAGFELERIVELPPFHYGAIFCRDETNTNQADLLPERATEE